MVPTGVGGNTAIRLLVDGVGNGQNLTLLVEDLPPPAVSAREYTFESVVNNSPGSRFRSFLPFFAMNNSGTVAFEALEGFGPVTQGIYVGSGGAFSRIAQVDGQSFGGRFLLGGMNAQGHVCFLMGALTGPAIYRWAGPGSEPRIVVGPSSRYPPSDYPGVIADNGAIAYFAGGTERVFGIPVGLGPGVVVNADGSLRFAAEGITHPKFNSRGQSIFIRNSAADLQQRQVISESGGNLTVFRGFSLLTNQLFTPVPDGIALDWNDSGQVVASGTWISRAQTSTISGALRFASQGPVEVLFRAPNPTPIDLTTIISIK